jgi:hypothetical protein
MAHYEPQHLIDGIKHPFEDVVVLNSEMLEYGAKRAREVVEAARREGYDWFNYENTLAGILGQGAVTWFLTGDEKLGMDQMNKGTPDDGFDVLWRGWHLEVKTFRWFERPKQPHSWLLVPLRQFYKSVPDAYFAVQRVKHDTFVLLGVISNEKLELHSNIENNALFKDEVVLVGPLFDIDLPEAELEYKYVNDVALTSFNLLTTANSFKTMAGPGGFSKKEVLGQI